MDTDNALAQSPPPPHLMVASHGADGSIGSSLAPFLRKAVDRALAEPLRTPAELRAVKGMSGQRYRQLLNDLIATLPNPRYLEVGSYKGSTLCSAIAGNTLRATAIDNWSLFGGPAAEFYTNLVRFKGPGARVSIVEEDYRAVDFKHLGRFNVYMFDGPHLAQDQYDGVMLAQPAMDDEVIVIVDDWNWSEVRSGTARAFNELPFDIETWIEIRTTLDDSHPAISGKHSDWHNGYLITALRRR